jgi:lipoprotein-anchoring transpeptidase ErfK/SrfK
VTPAVEGKGIDLDALTTAIETGFAKGQSSVQLTPTTTAVAAATTTEYAQTTATSLNKLLGTVGFYVGKERTVPVARGTAASWLTLSTHPDGSISVDADAAAIQKVVATLPKAVNRAPVNGTVITDTEGKVLSTETAALDGRTLGDTSSIATAFATQLAKGDGAYQLPVTVAKATTTKVSRNIVVDLSTQTATLYQNGKVFRTYLISSGLPGHDTHTGSFRIFGKVYIQDMGCFPGAPYCTKNVPWVSYFNGDQALHGAYWHHNFGHQMSHGCVNMPLDVAKFVYYWAPIGTEVRVQY